MTTEMSNYVKRIKLVEETVSGEFRPTEYIFLYLDGEKISINDRQAKSLVDRYNFPLRTIDQRDGKEWKHKHNEK
jgi:uncharacterized protein YqiB (DUF1249 family)